MTPRLLIVGAGGLAREMAQLGRALGLGTPDNTWLIDRHDEDAAIAVAVGRGFTGKAILAVGSATARHAAWRQWRTHTPNDLWPALVHPLADVGDTTTLGAGSVVTSGVITTSDVRIGEGVLLNLQVTVGHEAVIGDCCVINPSATLSGGVTLGSAVLVGTGANILEGITVGDGATIGGGAVVTRNVDAGTTVAGVPAKVLGRA